MGRSKTPEDGRFSKFGTVSFTRTTKVNDFIDFLEDGRVMCSRCRQCGETFFPPRADCCSCLASEMEFRRIEGAGKLVSFSRLSFAPSGFENDLPYTIALLDYGDFRVFGRINSGEEDDSPLAIGMDMKTMANRLPNGQLNFVFRKVDAAKKPL